LLGKREKVESSGERRRKQIKPHNPGPAAEAQI